MLYLDSSAIVKLVVPEPGSGDLVNLLRSDPEVVSSVLARVEVLRAVGRIGASAEIARRAEAVLDRIALVRLEDHIVEAAGVLEPRDLPTLDAIHLATALTLGQSLGGIVAYDARLASAARSAGLTVLAPGVG